MKIILITLIILLSILQINIVIQENKKMNDLKQFINQLTPAGECK